MLESVHNTTLGDIPKRTLASTKSLRPKPFKRSDPLNFDVEDEELFLARSIHTLKTGTFLEIHTKCQLDKHERFKYKEDRLIKAAEDAEKHQKFLERELLRNELLETERQKHHSNTKFIEDLKVNWKATQQVKKDRQIRDLQYELSLLKKAELKDICDRNLYSSSQKDGFVSFEKIMKRNGIGASEDGNGPPLSVSYEDSSGFNDRLTAVAKAQWPTNEEVGDFMTQLKERTQEKKAARYEKARRRRRASLEQEQAEAMLSDDDGK